MSDGEENTRVLRLTELVGKPQSQSAYLIVISAKSAAGVGVMFKVELSEVVLGRSVEAHLQVTDDGISRKHAKVVRDPNGSTYRLVDLGSTNGTYLNGERIENAPLSDGDKIQIGSNTILKFALQDQLEEQYQRSIYESATRDGLTKLFNKKYFVDSLAKEFAYCVRHHTPLSVVMMDVDHFKSVNDTYGHPAGDQVLQRLAQRISESARTEDVFARFGGEEFSLMMRQATLPQALAAAERCRRAVAATSFEFGGKPVQVTMSLGVASMLDGEYPQAEDLVQAADECLYKAKRGGRNRVEGPSGGRPLTAKSS